MENAHLRLGLLEHVRITEKASTRIRLRVDRYEVGEDRQAHLLSIFGNDSDVGAITGGSSRRRPPSTSRFLVTQPRRSLSASTPPAKQGRGDAARP